MRLVSLDYAEPLRRFIRPTSESLIIELGGFHSYKIVYIGIFDDPENGCNSLSLNGRGERIRTSDPLVPNQGVSNNSPE